jgi:hypothetical protein
VADREPWVPWLVGLLNGVEWLGGFIFVLGVSKRGCPLWPDAHMLLVPVGVAFVAHAMLVAARIDPRYASLPPKNWVATIAIMGLLGLAAIGLGANRIHHAAGFRALTLPLCIAFAGCGLVLIVRGRRAVPARLSTKMWQWRTPRPMGLIFFALGGYGVALALGATSIGAHCA